jgi:hypothetical protein
MYLSSYKDIEDGLQFETMDAIFQRFVKTNFSELPGLRVDASIPVTERLANELIEVSLRGNRNIESCRLSIGGQNRVSVNLKIPRWPWPLNLKLKLFHAVDLSGSPKVRAFLENNMLLGKLGAQLNALPKGITIFEDQVSVDLGSFIETPEQRQILELVKAVEIRTEPGILIFDVMADNA